MKLLKLELTNVLSFDHAVLDAIEPPCTYIVGPNGAGKTNLIRAMRFTILSMMAPHSLRDHDRAMLAFAPKLGTIGGTGRVSAFIEFDGEEQDLLRSLLWGALVKNSSTILPVGGHSAERLQGFNQRVWDDTRVDPLSSGMLVATYKRLPRRNVRISTYYDFRAYNRPWRLVFFHRQSQAQLVPLDSPGNDHRATSLAAAWVRSLNSNGEESLTQYVTGQSNDLSIGCNALEALRTCRSPIDVQVSISPYPNDEVDERLSILAQFPGESQQQDPLARFLPLCVEQ